MQRIENQWESELNIISSIQVVIPVKLYLVCNQIAGKVGGNEFSILTDIKEKITRISCSLTNSIYLSRRSIQAILITYLMFTIIQCVSTGIRMVAMDSYKYLLLSGITPRTPPSGFFTSPEYLGIK